MKEVTKEERWDFVKDKNVSYFSTGSFPYTGIWKDSRGNILAKDVPVGKHLGIKTDRFRYFIAS